MHAPSKAHSLGLHAMEFLDCQCHDRSSINHLCAILNLLGLVCVEEFYIFLYIKGLESSGNSVSSSQTLDSSFLGEPESS